MLGQSFFWCSAEQLVLQVHVELSVRADKDIPDGTEIPIQFIVRMTPSYDGSSTSGQLDFSKDVSLIVKDLTATNSPAMNYTDSMKARDQ